MQLLPSAAAPHAELVVVAPAQAGAQKVLWMDPLTGAWRSEALGVARQSATRGVDAWRRHGRASMALTMLEIQLLIEFWMGFGPIRGV